MALRARKKEGVARIVVRGGAAFGVDDATLGLDDLGVESEVADAVGLHVEHQFERGGGEPVGVNGDVAGRIGVGGDAFEGDGGAEDFFLGGFRGEANVRGG